MNELKKYFSDPPSMPDMTHSSVHYSSYRLEEARRQAEKEPAKIEVIIALVNQILEKLQIPPVPAPLVKSEAIDYQKIKEENDLADERDIVWMKFTKDGYLGVVATSSDINFNYPPSKKEYHKRVEGKWLYHSSGILIHALGKEWDTDFVLIFPLRNLPQGMTRHDIEKAVGNYLTENEIPLLDFYSHNY